MVLILYMKLFITVVLANPIEGIRVIKGVLRRYKGIKAHKTIIMN